MQEISKIQPSKQLDLVLECLSLPDYPCHNTAQVCDWLIRYRWINANVREVDFILYYLVEQGYASDDKELVAGLFIDGQGLYKLDELFYFLTFPGKVFIANGGYKQLSRDVTVKRLIRGFEVFAIIVGGVFAALYYFEQLIKEIINHVF